MRVAKIHQPDLPSRSSVHTEADAYVLMAMRTGSALHGMPAPKAGEEMVAAAEIFEAAAPGAIQRRIIGARLRRPVHLEAVDHPEAERELVLELHPRSRTTARVRFHEVGRAKPRIVLDDVLIDE